MKHPGAVLVAMVAAMSAAHAGPKAGAAKVYDRGTFVGGRATENFSITRVPEGLRIQFELSSPTLGGIGYLVTDAAFHPLHGVMKSYKTKEPTKVATTELRTRDDGVLVVEATDPLGRHSIREAKRKADWYLGGPVTAFFTPVCTAPPRAAHAIAFPEATIELSAATPLAVVGITRHVFVRRVEFPSKRTWVVACEDGKVVGVTSSGGVVARAGDAEVAKALAKL